MAVTPDSDPAQFHVNNVYIERLLWNGSCSPVEVQLLTIGLVVFDVPVTAILSKLG
jgi:hypothetical protein